MNIFAHFTTIIHRHKTQKGSHMKLSKSYLFKEITYAHIISLLLQGGSNTKIYHVIVKLTLFISNERKQKIVEIILLILYVALLCKHKNHKRIVCLCCLCGNTLCSINMSKHSKDQRDVAFQLGGKSLKLILF